jgi:hypothetical protein
MGVEQTKLEDAQKDFDTAVGLLKEMEGQLSDRHELEEIEKMMADFYKEQEEALKKYEEERQARDVKGISAEYNAIFSHAFNIPEK